MIAHPQNTSQIGTYTHIHIHSTPYLGSKKKKVWKPKAAVFFCVFFATSRGEKYRLVGRKLLIIHAHMYNQMSSLPPCSVRGCVRLPFLSSPSAITKKSTKKKKKEEKKKKTAYTEREQRRRKWRFLSLRLHVSVCAFVCRNKFYPQRRPTENKKKKSLLKRKQKKKNCVLFLLFDSSLGAAPAAPVQERSARATACACEGSASTQ